MFACCVLGLGVSSGPTKVDRQRTWRGLLRCETHQGNPALCISVVRGRQGARVNSTSCIRGVIKPDSRTRSPGEGSLLLILAHLLVRYGLRPPAGIWTTARASQNPAETKTRNICPRRTTSAAYNMEQAQPAISHTTSTTPTAAEPQPTITESEIQITCESFRGFLSCRRRSSTPMFAILLSRPARS